MKMCETTLVTFVANPYLEDDMYEMPVSNVAVLRTHANGTDPDSTIRASYIKTKTFFQGSVP